MPKCAGYKRDGTRCNVTVNLPQTLCWWHDPLCAEERKRNASKAGSSKPGSELKDAKRRIKEYVEGVINGTVDKGRASVAFQGLGVLCRFIEQERRIKEAEEFEQRLAALEEAQQKERGRSYVR